MDNESTQLAFGEEKSQADNDPVVCLGMTFKNDEERREYFREELRKKLPELKEIEGFPIGEDEDIIALSDPPYYTACPNPWVNDFIEEWEKEKTEKYRRDPEEEYNKEPFAADISEGKNHAIYMAHAYHTKVPHKAIMKYILHYTDPGDIIFDGFCGTGMTGVAAQMCGNESEVKSLFDSSEDPSFDIGERKAIISDLAPAATFISSNYNQNINIEQFRIAIEKIIKEIENQYGYLFETNHNENKAKINYIVWSEVISCPNCQAQFDYWSQSTDFDNKKTLKEFPCPNCSAVLTKRTSEKVYTTKFDLILNKNVEQVKMVPTLINYTFEGKRYTKSPDSFDLEIIEEASRLNRDTEFVNVPLPEGYNTNQPKNSHGFTHVHHLYSDRNNIIMREFYNRLNRKEHFNLGLFVLTASMQNLSFLYRWRVSGKGGITTSTYYVCSTPQENNPFLQLRRKLNDICNVEFNFDKSVISTSSITQSMIHDNSIDYIFTDPPFGANIMYSEVNFLWESCLKVKSNNEKEAIINPFQRKDWNDYQMLMYMSFTEYYRVLKPGRWITIEFSNSQASIWNSIQEAIQKAGFIIANVSALDKKQGSFKAVTTTTAVKQDLVISAYKPKKENIEKIKRQENTYESAWTFVTQHLEQLPIFDGKKGEDARVLPERTPRILFDKMVAFHVQNGLTVPISSAEFQTGVAQHFPMRDGMAFLENQVAEYDKKRTMVKVFSQLSLFVSDENSAIEWLRQQLMKKPQTRQDIHPSFMKELQHIAKHEKLPELDDLLNQNFLRYDGDDPVPNQILAYLRRTYKDIRGLEPTDTTVVEKAMHRWYVPDPNKQADLEKLREKALLREYDGYLQELEGNKKKLKTFRTEAIRAGFKKAYSDKDFESIVKVGERIPEKVIQEDDKLLMYYDNACIRLGL